MKIISRREFLKFFAVLPLSQLSDRLLNTSDHTFDTRSLTPNNQHGRIFSDGAKSHIHPDAFTGIVNTYHVNEIVNLKEPILIKKPTVGNSLWYRLDDGGFMSAKEFQPVERQFNAPNLEVGNSGRLAEVTVPFTDAWSSNKSENKPNKNFYYGTTHWVIGHAPDEDKNIYYLIKEDRWGDRYYVDATHMRIIDDDELQPVSPEIPESEKKIKVYLDEQIMVAYEKDAPVFMTPIASGLLAGDINVTTPRGSYFINYKRPSRHMVHSERFGANDAELFGVPWVSYFTDTGIAFHGTFWHNDFTKPKSHGCINLPIPAAKWIYLWSNPVISPRQEKHTSRYGTSVEIL